MMLWCSGSLARGCPVLEEEHSSGTLRRLSAPGLYVFPEILIYGKTYKNTRTDKHTGKDTHTHKYTERERESLRAGVTEGNTER